MAESNDEELVTTPSSSMVRAAEAGPVKELEVRAWYVYDFANSPFFQVMTTLTPFLLTLVAKGHCANVKSDTMPVLGISPESFTPFVRFTMIAIQVVCILSFSAFGDFGGGRKLLLQVLTFAGSFFLALNMFTISYSMWWLPMLLRMLAGICFCMCGVYYNAYLPMLAGAHYTLSGLVNSDERDKKENEIADELSNKGQAWGYVGGVAMQVICILLLKFTECDPSGFACSEFQMLWPPCLCILLVGVWWAVFSLYTFKHLKLRPGPSFPTGANILCLGWKTAFGTLRLMCEYRDMGIFTLSFFMFSDAFSTMLDLVLYCSGEESQVVPSSLLMLGIQATVLGLLGIVLFYGLQSFLGLSAKAMLLAQLGGYAVCSLVMAVVGAGLFAKDTPFWQYALVMLPLALMVGSLQANARSVFSSLTPVGKEAAFFAFYAFTDKGSALIGNAVTGVYAHHTSEYAGVFWYCVLMFVLSSVLLLFVDVERGTEEANHHEDESSEDGTTTDE